MPYLGGVLEEVRCGECCLISLGFAVIFQLDSMFDWRCRCRAPCPTFLFRPSKGSKENTPNKEREYAARIVCVLSLHACLDLIIGVHGDDGMIKSNHAD